MDNEIRSDENLIRDMEHNVRRLIFSYMIIGRFPNDWSFEAYNDYLSAAGVTLRCFLFWPDKRDTDSRLKRSLSAEIEKEFPYVCARAYDNFVVCLSFDRHDRPEINEAGIRRIITGSAGVDTITCFCSAPLSDLWQMVSAYHELCAEAEKTIEEVADKGGRVIQLYVLEKEVMENIFEYDSDNIRAVLEEIARLVDSVNRHDWLRNQSYFCFLWRYIDRGIFRKSGKRASIPEKDSIDHDLQSAEGLDEVVNILCAFIDTFADVVGLKRHGDSSGNYHRIIEMAKQYIKDNCAADVSLERVSREVGLSSFYLSKLFKKEEGINYKDYVISVRMEKARALILEGKMNVSEVAVAVGYSNNTYFGKAFKSYFNVTAKDMRLHIKDIGEQTDSFEI